MLKESLGGLEFGDEILDKTPKPSPWKKLLKLLKRRVLQKILLRESKDKPQSVREIFIKYISDKGLTSKYIKSS